MTPPKKRGRFLIPTLLAAGFAHPDAVHAAFIQATSTGTDDPNAGSLFRTFRQQHLVILAQHRSHSSHSSHRSSSGGGGGHYSHMSHTSHRSSYGGGGYDPPTYSPPAPVYTPPAPPAPPRRAPQPLLDIPRSTTPAGQLRATPPTDMPADTSAAPAPSGRAQRFAAIVRRVQIALMAQDDFQGPITGTVGPVTRAALRRFQAARGLTVTGTVTPETLDALRVSSE